MNPRYSILIRWSDGDRCYVASLPEFGPYAESHGQTYEEALALLIEDTLPLPEPQTYIAGSSHSRIAA
uniref:HicB_like antitoxin of toxin-antitoxin system n=1 Tax=Candidatus Kentrum sp. FW TaxID=2126338 RepID=A0A450U4C2_9GAMM|nr:MAG: hypothetical protein BECKFW1821C_GA0114237_11811 [Candidatus Kentron sp. FW]